MRNVAVLEVTYPGFDPDLDNALRSAVGRRSDQDGAGFGTCADSLPATDPGAARLDPAEHAVHSAEDTIRAVSWEFGTMEEAEKARERVNALSWPFEILAYIYVPRTDRPGEVGAQPAAA